MTEHTVTITEQDWADAADLIEAERKALGSNVLQFPERFGSMSEEELRAHLRTLTRGRSGRAWGHFMGNPFKHGGIPVAVYLIAEEFEARELLA